MTYQFVPGASDTDISLITDHAALRHYAQSTDPRSFEVLTRRYQGMVLATCRRVLGSGSDADDAVRETFLGLARNAGQVRSNVAAWLHACAFRISIDLQRRHAARRRAEAKASPVAADGDSLATWRELEPLIDEALSKLHEADRELIVSRFLVGRSQAEMPEEAGVNPGTIHRRIDAALERLRTHLRAGGCVLGAAAVAAALHHAPASAKAGSALGAALGKVALSQVAAGVGAAPATAPLGTGGAAWIAASVAGVLLTGGASALFLSQPGRPPSPAHSASSAAIQEKRQSVLTSTGSSFARPSKTIGGYALRENYSESPVFHRLYFDGTALYFGPDALLKKSENGVRLNITAINPAANPPSICFIGVPTGGNVGEKARGVVGRTIDATYSVQGRLLTVRGAFDDDGKVKDHYAVRPAPGSSIDKPGNAAGNDAALAGAWVVVNDLALQFTSDEVSFTFQSSDTPAERYRIIEWVEADGYAKVQTICTAYTATRGVVGKRLKMLVRKEEKGYTLLGFNPDSAKRDTWPDRFEYLPDKQMWAFVFRKD
ncbi:MAG TPA: sigma-70 family RNA polymerase sigma factor [Phycisphaerales bacterium]|nr:sigma-70 family RNA polymerase sigma factor [Phycisphaerales bacterium]